MAMTVKELKESLSKYGDDYKVVVSVEDEDAAYPTFFELGWLDSMDNEVIITDGGRCYPGA